MRWRNVLRVLVLCGLWSSTVASCKDPAPVHIGDVYGIGATGGSGADGGAGGQSVSSSSSSSTGGGGGGGGDACPETCQPNAAPSPWFSYGYVLLWEGAVDETPLTCPDNVPTDWWDGYANLIPATCPQCSCLPPQGSCSPPAKLKAYYTAVCPAPGNNAPYQSFDAPLGWNGSCTSANSVAADPSCSGNNCIQSLAIDPPVVNDPPACEPGPSTPTAIVPPHWANKLRMCRTEATYPITLCKKDHFCAPSLSPGFRACVQAPMAAAKGRACPPDWSNRIEGYHGFTDTTTCSACSCGSPSGSKCSASISAYTDQSDCTGLHVTALVDSAQSSWCFSLPPGTGLLSKAVDQSTYIPGSCSPMGGALSGSTELDESDAYTFCCQ